MMISTKGRYALRIMIDLAENYSGEYITMKSVARRQELPLKYIERLMPVLTKNSLVEGVHGKGGGYRLTRKPQEYKVGDILRLMEGNLSPVACLACDAKDCSRAVECRTLPMWKEFHDVINNYFDEKSLADLIEKDA